MFAQMNDRAVLLIDALQEFLMARAIQRVSSDWLDEVAEHAADGLT